MHQRAYRTVKNYFSDFITILTVATLSFVNVFNFRIHSKFMIKLN